MEHFTAKLHDGSTLDIQTSGAGPALLLPIDPNPADADRAEELRAWGVDPARGPRIIAGLRDIARVVAFDYEGHVLAHPKPDTLTIDNVVADLLSVADAAGAETFAYAGYSWTAMAGLQLAIRSPRVSALAMGGYPPLDGPYEEMLRVTTAGYEIATGIRTPTETQWAGLSADQGKQFVTLYESLRGFDDRSVQRQLTCPRLCFAGDADNIQYGADWGDVHVDISDPIVRHRADLETLGWEVRILPGLDHTQAMQPDHLLPVLCDWLPSALRL